jgi:hypothetical protein
MAKMSQMQLILAKFCHGDKPVARLLTIYNEEGTPHINMIFSNCSFLDV